MGKRAVTAGLFVCAAVAACNLGSSDDEASTSESANTAARQPILGPTWLKCWVEKDGTNDDPARQPHAVKCHYDAPDEKQPVKPQGVIVDVHYAAGSNHIESLEQHPGEDFVVQKVAGDQFPIEINVVVHGETFRNVGLTETWFELNTKVERPEGLSVEQPLVVKQPFDVWPVIVIPKATIAYAQLDERTVSVAPLMVGQNGTSSDASARGRIIARTAEPEPSITYFAAPKEGELKGSYKASVGGSMTDIAAGARIPGPGVYVATETEFRRATDEEASAVGPAPLPPSSTDASAPADDAGTEASAEASAPPRDCGVPGKPCCGGFGGTCDPGSYCPSSQNTCEACGGPGQKCCGGFGGSCNAGSYCPSNQNTCEACGGPGQKCCGGFGGSCNAGSYCPSNQNTCEACGKVGQKCCGGFNGTCEAGGRCPSNQNICVSN